MRRCALLEGMLAQGECVFFAHSPTELRVDAPETLTEVAQLKDKLLAEMFTRPVYADVLRRLLNVMSVTQAAELVSCNASRSCAIQDEDPKIVRHVLVQFAE